MGGLLGGSIVKKLLLSISLATLFVLGACGGDSDSSTAAPADDAGTADSAAAADVSATTDGSTTPDAGTAPDAGAPEPDIVLGPACAEPTASENQVLYELNVGGMTRQYRLTVPQAEAGVPLAVMVGFHGGGGAYDDYPQEEAFRSLGAEQGVIMAYPRGAVVAPNEGEWQLNTSDDMMHDIDFINALLDDLSTRYCVDITRLYATGYSLGSMFIYEVACQMNDRFAAVASFAGSMPISVNSCEMVNKLPVMHIHGTDDSIIPYSDEWDWKSWPSVGPMMDIPQLMEFWGDQNGCQDVDWTDNSDGRHVVYDGCDEGVRVEHHRLDGHGHWWPQTIDGVSTHQVMWNFMSGFTR